MPIILTTGYLADAEEQDLPGNVVTCLEKPLDLIGLGQALRQALSRETGGA